MQDYVGLAAPSVVGGDVEDCAGVFLERDDHIAVRAVGVVEAE